MGKQNSLLNNKFKGVWTPAEILELEDINFAQKYILSAILWLSNNDGYCSANNDNFAVMFSITNRAARRQIAELTARGYIQKEDRTINNIKFSVIVPTIELTGQNAPLVITDQNMTKTDHPTEPKLTRNWSILTKKEPKLTRNSSILTTPIIKDNIKEKEKEKEKEKKEAVFVPKNNSTEKTGMGELEPAIPPELEEVLLDVARYFKVEEQTNYTSYADIFARLHLIYHNNLLDPFKEQLSAYRAFKSVSGEKRAQNYKTFLGSLESGCKDGDWNRQNWGSTLKEFKEGEGEEIQKLVSGER